METEMRVPTCGDCIHADVCARVPYFTEFSRDNPAYCYDFKYKTYCGWIPVTERLPEIGGYYLVHQMNPRYKTSFIQHARYSENQEKWLGALALCSLDFVTHWMPLPPAPEDMR